MIWAQHAGAMGHHAWCWPVTVRRVAPPLRSYNVHDCGATVVDVIINRTRRTPERGIINHSGTTPLSLVLRPEIFSLDYVFASPHVRRIKRMLHSLLVQNDERFQQQPGP